MYQPEQYSSASDSGQSQPDTDLYEVSGSSPPEEFSEFYRAAQELAQLGFSVFPLLPGEKAPNGALGMAPNGYKDATQDETTLHNWWKRSPRSNVGIVMDGMVVVDVDVPGIAHPNGSDGFKALADRGIELPDTLAAITGSGGVHLFYWEPAGHRARTKLATILAECAGVDWKADGAGYVVAAPSIHPDTGLRYRWDDADKSIATLPESFYVERPHQEPVGGQRDPSDRTLPGNDFNYCAEWGTDVLEPHGWELVYDDGAEAKWRRPGARTRKQDAVVYYDNDTLTVFSDNDDIPLEARKPYNKFGAYTFLNHGGDFSASAKDLRAQGYGGEKSTSVRGIGGEYPLSQNDSSTSGISTYHKPWESKLTELDSAARVSPDKFTQYEQDLMTEVFTEEDHVLVSEAKLTVGGTRAFLREKVSEEDDVTLRNVDNSGPSRSTVKLTTICLDDVEHSFSYWLWDGRLKMGGLAVITGMPFLGKSLVSIDIATKITRGKLEGEHFGTPRNVGIVATEDEYEDTIKPRFMAAGADLKRIHLIEVEDTDANGDVTLPRDITALERVITDLDLALVVLDPLISRLDASLNTNSDPEVRQALEPLNKMAARTNCVILGIMHSNKSGSSNSGDRVMASRAFTAVPRSTLFAAACPDIPEEVLIGGENNNGPKKTSLRFRKVETFAFEKDGRSAMVGTVEWLGEDSRTIDEALYAANRGKKGPTKQEACETWLGGFITGHIADHDGHGPSPTAVRLASMQDGHSWATVRRAKKDLEIESEYVPDSMPSAYEWKLPAHFDGES